jgi:MerR family transcriptional regulator, light-induced transcriptional regulator
MLTKSETTNESSDTPLFTAGEVEDRTGIPATTLRQWERRYGLPNPRRSVSGYRLYSQNDLKLIEFFKTRIGQGISVSRAAQLYALDRSLPSLQNAPDQPVPPAQRVTAPSDLVAQLVDSTVRGESFKSDKILAQAHATMSVERVVLDLIQPTFVEIGERWHRGEVTIAHEHQATHYLRGKLHHLLELAGTPRQGPTVVLACPPNEWHEIGALSVALFLRRAGIRTHYLGANTPVADLAHFASEVKADAIMLSASTPEVIEGLRIQAHLLVNAAPMVVYGGYAFSQNPELATELGGHFVGNNAGAALDFMLSYLQSRDAASTAQRAVYS